jgi:glycosyltransferase involved in cell wall biosynthesis
MNVAVLHDGAIHPGGAVDVVLEAARALDADLVIGFSGKDRSWWVDRAPNDVRVLTYREKMSTFRDAVLAWRWLNLDLQEYDLVVSSGPSTKFYQPYDDQRVVHYMHHPPLSSLWFEGGLFDYALRVIDRIETWSLPTVVANSELTGERMVSQYNRQPDAVVNPPVDVEQFSPDARKDPDTVVMVGRLEERKRPMVAVRAFRRLLDRDPTPELRLLGDGPTLERIQRAAPDNVSVEGYVSDDELVSAVERASAGMFLARREDFGLTPVEYMAAGTPVVGVDEPNTNRQVTDGETGVLVDPDPSSVAEGVERALDAEWDRDRLRATAETYGRAAFERGLREVVDDVTRNDPKPDRRDRSTQIPDRTTPEERNMEDTTGER